MVYKNGGLYLNLFLKSFKYLEMNLSSVKQYRRRGIGTSFQNIKREVPVRSNEIKQLISSCNSDQELAPSLPIESMQQSSASRPFQFVSSNLMEVNGKPYLAVVDCYSGWSLIS
uniref:Putative LOC100890456 [Strongylocentrotus purpuratus] n=1 Tax=Lepeophtheirus salmonis TaxID=72036 RepID=A0A0K2UC15_LEPSM